MPYHKIVRSRSFWIGVLIGILGFGSFWLPMLGIPIAILTIAGAWIQGYENEKASQEFTAKVEYQQQLVEAAFDRIKHIIVLSDQMATMDIQLIKLVKRISEMRRDNR